MSAFGRAVTVERWGYDRSDEGGNGGMVARKRFARILLLLAMIKTGPRDHKE